MKGQKNIEDAVTKELGIKFGETTKDRRITLEYTNCLGMCDVAPAMLVNERVYTKIDPETAVKILKDIK